MSHPAADGLELFRLNARHRVKIWSKLASIKKRAIALKIDYDAGVLMEYRH